MTPGCTFKTAFAVLCTQRCKIWSCTFWGELSVSGLVASCQASALPRPLLTAFWLFRSSPPALEWKPFRQNGSFLADARKPCVPGCQGGSASEEGCMGFSAAVLGGSQPPVSSPRPPRSTDVQKVDVTGSLITKQLANTVYENPVLLAAQHKPVKSRGFHCFGSCPGYLPMLMHKGCLAWWAEQMTLGWVDSSG